MIKHRPRQSERGQILILTALSMTVLLGMAALSVDAGFMYAKRNDLSAAADASAKIGAAEVHRNAAVTLAALETFANQQVSAHGFTPAACGVATVGVAVVCINHPPVNGPFAGNANYVEALVSQVTSTFFGNILGVASLVPGARAVAGTSTPSNCLTTLAPPGSIPTALDIGNSNVILNGCGVGDAGDLSGSNPNARITGSPTPGVAVVGTCSGTCGSMGVLVTGAAAPIDPLAGLAVPTVGGACVAGAAATLSAGCYSSIASSVTTLNAGIYKITGIVDIGHLTGTNVMIYLTGGGQLTAANNRDLSLTAPTSGTYSGIAIFQDPLDTNGFNAGNSFTLTVSGAIYMPGVDVNFPNSLSVPNTGCTLFISKSLAIRNGNGTFGSGTCAGTYGGAAFLSVAIAE